MPRIAIVGAGQAGTQLALGLLERGYDVTLVSDRTPAEIRGRVRDVEPVHVRDRTADRAGPRAQPLGAGLPHRRADQLHAPRRRRRPLPMGVEARRLRTVGRPAREGRRLDRAVRRPRRKGRAQVGDRRGPRGSGAYPRPGRRVHRQGRARPTVPSRPGALAVRPAAACLGAHLRHRNGPTRGRPRGLVQRRARRRRVLRVPGADHHRPLRDHGLRRHPRRPDGLLGRRPHPRGHLARSLEILAKHFPDEADRCRDVALTDDGGVLRGRLTPTVRRPVASLPFRGTGPRPRRRCRAQRPAHRPGLQQRRQGCRRSTSTASPATAPTSSPPHG